MARLRDPRGWRCQSGQPDEPDPDHAGGGIWGSDLPVESTVCGRAVRFHRLFWRNRCPYGQAVSPRFPSRCSLLTGLHSGHAFIRDNKELKPEAITVLEESTSAYRVLVLSDGMCDGGPLVFTIAR